MKTILLVGLGSFVGGVLRYGVYLAADAIGWRSMVATFVVNIVGCLVLGIICGAVEQGCDLDSHLRQFLAVGVCGGFTTYSTFINDHFHLLRDGNLVPTLLYVVCSLVVGFLLLYVGYWLGSIISSGK